MRTNKLTVMRQLLIAEEGIQVDNVKATERKQKAHTSQILLWKQIMPIQNENSEIFPKKLILHREKIYRARSERKLLIS